MKFKKRQSTKVLRSLKGLIGHDEWFISGSFANDKANYFGDIDVYFYDQEGFDSAIAYATRPKNPHEGHWEESQSNATAHTFFYKKKVVPRLFEEGTEERLENIGLPVQLIARRKGTPEYVFEHFDMNVCKKAILSTGEHVIHHSADKPIRLERLHSESFNRFIKYISKLKQTKNITALAKPIIDDNIANSDVLEDAYSLVSPSPESFRIANILMFDTFKHEPKIKDYLYKQAKLHAPELLL
jgi:hypothetical protein